MTDLEISRAWLVDPAAGREGPGEIVVRDGILEAVTWLDGADADGVDADGVVVAPGFIDLHAHLREPGNEDAETVATGLAAAAHGGFTTVCAMPNTTPALDEPGVLARDAGGRRGVRVAGRAARARRGDGRAGRGARWRRSASWPMPGVVGFSDDGAPVRSASILRNALAYAGALGLPIVDHPEDADPDRGRRGERRLRRDRARAARLAGRGRGGGRRPRPRDPRRRPAATCRAPGCTSPTSRRPAPLELVRRAKAAGLPVTCDVTPHHLALTDEWVAGARRWAWEAGGRRPVARRRDRRGAVRVVAAGQPAAPRAGGRAGVPGRPRRRHGRRDRHRPRAAHRGRQGGRVRAGGERDQRHRDGAGRRPRGGRRRAAAAGARDRGADDRARPRVLGGRSRRDGSVGLVEGAPADLVVFDRSERWTVTPDALASQGKNSPLLGMELPGRVLLTIAGGRVAYEAPDARLGVTHLDRGWVQRTIDVDDQTARPAPSCRSSVARAAPYWDDRPSTCAASIVIDRVRGALAADPRELIPTSN